MNYRFIFEPTATGFSAYSPDVPGVGVAAPTRQAAEEMLLEAIAFNERDEPPKRSSSRTA